MARRVGFAVWAVLVGAALMGAAPYGASAKPITFKELLAREQPKADHRSTYGAEPDQFGELWLPKGKGPHPVVVVVHGGCWRADLPGLELTNYIADDLRKRGFAVWNIEYRRIGTNGGGYPGTFQDVAAATDHLKKLAATHKLDLTRVVSTGHSAGGHLALWLAARPRISPDSPLFMTDPLAISGVVTLAGINDLAVFRENGPGFCGGPKVIDGLTGAEARGAGIDVFADTSPAALAPLSVEQVIVTGELDPIVPPLFGRGYGALAKGLGDPVEVVEYPGAGHFEVVDPTSPAWKDIAAKIQALMPEAKAR